MSNPSRYQTLQPRIHQVRDSYPANPGYNPVSPGYNLASSGYNLFRPTPINPPAWLRNKDSRKGCNLSIPLALIRTTGDRLIERVSLAKASFTL